jgi:hypothetical protein
VLDLVNTVSFVVGVSASPRSERRAFRLAAWIWQSRLAVAFFRVAALGRGRSAAQRSRDRAAQEPRLEDLAPANVVARYPDLRATLRTVEQSRAALRVREAEITRALADAGGARPPAALDVSRVTDGQVGANGRASEHTLRDRRDALLDEMRDALETTRSRRTRMTAALENVRIQLLRLGAGIGGPDDMRQEIAALTELVAEPDGATVSSA